MRRSNVCSWVLLLLLLLALPLSLPAQQFTGTGQRATELFALREGLSVFELDHRAERGDFVVRLLDDRGVLIDEIAHATGRFGGSKAVRIPHDGQYLLDVSAAGAWTIRYRAAQAATSDSTTPGFARGREAGAAAAGSVSTTGWLARGLLGGTLLGPLGAGITVGMAGRSAIDVPEAASGSAPDLAFRDGYQQGFEAQLRSRRRKMAFVGGMVGSGIFVLTLIQVLDIAGSGEASGGGTTPPPGTNLVRIPS